MTYHQNQLQQSNGNKINHYQNWRGQTSPFLRRIIVIYNNCTYNKIVTGGESVHDHDASN